MEEPKQDNYAQLWFDAPISQFDGIKPHPLSVTPTVSQVIDYIKSDMRLKTDIEECREYLQSDLIENVHDPKTGKLLLENYDDSKKSLPGVTWTGTFEKRSNTSLLTFSGFLSFDIDFIDKHSQTPIKYDDEREKARQAYKILSRDKYSSLVFPSVSATGIKGLVKIPTVKSDAEYKSYFRAFKRYATQVCHQELDSLPDISRLCFLSYCENPYVNQDSEVFTEREDEQEQPPQLTEQITIDNDPSLRAAIEVLLRNGIRSEIDRNTFVGLCGAFKRSGVSYETFDKIMAKTPGYDAKGNFKIWNTVHEQHDAKKMTSASIIAYAREADKELFRELRKQYLSTGIEETDDVVGLATLIKRKLKTRYQFRLNSVSDKINIIEGEETRLMSDYEESRIRCWLLDNGFGKRDVISDVIRTVAHQHQFHPIEQYFKELQWDGQDHFQSIAEYFIEEDRMFPLFNTVFRAWCVGAVRRVFTGQHHQVLIFTGEQGKGKSFFARWLCPFDEYFLDAPMNPESNDTKIRMAENFIWEIGELGSTTRKSDVEALKQSISLEFPVFRRAHDKYDQRKKALASYIGTVNEDGAGFLNDPTGYRRWWPIRIAEIKFDYTSKIDVNQIWAQAFVLFQESASNCDIPGLIQEAIDSKIEREFSVSDPMEDLMLQVFEFTGNEQDRLSTVEILVDMERAGFRGKGTRADAMLLSKAIKRIQRQGYPVERYQHSTFRGYKGIVSTLKKREQW